MFFPLFRPRLILVLISPSEIKSVSTVTEGMPTPRQSRTAFCFLLLSLCMHACLIHCPPNRLWKLAHFPNTMMSCVEWKERSVPGLFHPFVRPTRAKGVTVKEVIFKCIYSAPCTPSTHLPLPLSPNCHRCMPANSLFLHFSNKSADNSRDCCPLFCLGKQFKMNFNWPGLGIHFILCMSALYNGPFCILKKKKMDGGSGEMPKKSRQSGPLAEPVGQTKASTQSRRR